MKEFEVNEKYMRDIREQREIEDAIMVVIQGYEIYNIIAALLKVAKRFSGIYAEQARNELIS